MIYKQSCSVHEPISKTTVLAMLSAPSTLGIHPGQTVQYTNESGMSYQLRVIRVERDTLTLATKDGGIVVPRSSVKSNAKPVYLDSIPFDSWTVTSFNPKSRVVCVDVSTPRGTRHMSVTLPLTHRA